MMDSGLEGVEVCAPGILSLPAPGTHFALEETRLR